MAKHDPQDRVIVQWPTIATEERCDPAETEVRIAEWQEAGGEIRTINGVRYEKWLSRRVM